jgi:alkyldihydroxyacetonephosphate synthase
MTLSGEQSEIRAQYLVDQIRREIAAVVGNENVSIDQLLLQQQSSDWSWISQHLKYKNLHIPSADIYASPGTAEEVADILRIACEYKFPVIPRGGGSGTQGGTVAIYGGIALDLRRLNKVLEIDEISMVVTAQSGIEGPELEKILNAKGLTMPHYPGSFHFGATLGGYLAARGSGVVSTKYGKAEDMVLQLEVAMPPGRLIETMKVPSHASGPGIIQAIVGSEGTLGIITKATMRIERLPESQVFLSYGFKDISTGLEAARLIMVNRWRPAVIRLYDEADSAKLSSWLNLGVEGVLIVVMCDGTNKLTELESNEIAKLCESVGGTSYGPEIGKMWWDGKYEPFKHGNIPAPPQIFGTTDTCARFEDLERIYWAKKEAIEVGFAEYGARYTAHFSHWFPWGGMIYDRFYIDNGPEDSAEAIALHDRVWDAAIKASLDNGGSLNEHHGVGLKLGRFMRIAHGAAFDLLLGVKNAWDPDGILNPGKLGFGPPRNRQN